MAKICKHWDENACVIEKVTFERLRDFFRVSGEVTNALDCTLPHLQLRVVVVNRKAKQLSEDIFHITDRKLEPGEKCLFKLEGEWKTGMAETRVTVWPFLKHEGEA